MHLFWKAKVFFIIHFVALRILLLISVSIKNILKSNIFSSFHQGRDILSLYAYFSRPSKPKFLMLIEILSAGEAFLNIQEDRQASKT